MYCIYQKDESSNEQITDILNYPTAFLQTVKNKLTEPAKVLETINEDAVISNNCFAEGLYLLVNDNEIKLVKKYKKENKGYIYSSSKMAISVLFQWKLLPYNVKMQTNALNIKVEKDNLSITDSDSSSEEMQNDNYSIQSFKKFDLEIMKENPRICIIGKRGCGKTTIVKKLVESLDFEENILVMSMTEKFYPFYSKNFPKANVLFNYDSNAIEQYLANQKKTGQKGCIVFDDCIMTKSKLENDQAFVNLFYNARHYNTTVILTMQCPLAIRPDIRMNFDYVFMFNEDFLSNQKRLFDHYCGILPSFDIFRNVFLELTQDYSCIVVNNCGKSIGQNIMYFKA